LNMQKEVNMRKRIYGLVGGVMMFALTSCSGANSDQTVKQGDLTTTPTVTITENTATSEPTIDPAIEAEATLPPENNEETSESNYQEDMKVFAQILSETKLKSSPQVTHTFANVSVHDPSIIKVEDTFYVFGSHLAAAKSTDLINWELIASGVSKDNPIIPDAQNEMKKAFTWAHTNTFWAPDVIQLDDGRFYMYYCNCEGSSPLSALGVAVSDSIEGPYTDLGIILKSGMKDELSEDGDTYNANRQPNVVDPCVFYDKEHRLWMMYGSYSGGIFIIELDPATGMPLESGYGKKLLGMNHLRIEGAFVQYSPETDYYYMFLSFGGLGVDGGYNIRVCRSENPDGPYVDSADNPMILCQGASGTFFHDADAEAYGAKLIGNFHWESEEGEDKSRTVSYVSPGHNSTYYDEETGKYFLVFHTRFEGAGDRHQVRVHQMFINEDGWFVVAPYRYVGETIGSYTMEDVVGAYKVVNHGHDISADVKTSVNVVLTEDGKILGDYTGSWELSGDHTCKLTIDGVEYKGVFLEQWDEQGLKNVLTFSVLSLDGVSIWGSGYEAR
jgi:arabinan endo-1,5-alpha-L-arabinosidase